MKKIVLRINLKLRRIEMEELMKVNLGDKVQSKITGAVGEVIEISEDRGIKVLEDNGFISVFSSENALVKIKK